MKITKITVYPSACDRALQEFIIDWLNLYVEICTWLKVKIVKLDFIYLYFEWEFPSMRTSVGALRIILP
jgi:hypothetical protein